MQLLFLCKQKYMHKDVVHDRYGRLHELPYHLSRYHRITAIALNYHATPAFKPAQCFRENDGKLTWYSLQAHVLLLPTLVAYWRLVLRELRENPPAVVIGASDCPHVILASMIAGMHGVPVIMDLYDNFEAFGLSKVPGIKTLYRRALKRADAVTCVSSRLRDFVKPGCGPSKPVVAIESTINNADFHPLDKKSARRSLGLDPQGTYVGAAGSLYANRGIDTVYTAFREVVEARPEVKLLLAGELDRSAPPPEHANVVYLGKLPHSHMNSFYNSLNVAFNYMQDDDFGRYSFPQKAYEILACKVPVLSARVGVFTDLLQEEQFLYTPGNAGELAAKIPALLDEPAVPELNIPTWADQAARLNDVICGLFTQKGS